MYGEPGIPPPPGVGAHQAPWSPLALHPNMDALARAAHPRPAAMSQAATSPPSNIAGIVDRPPFIDDDRTDVTAVTVNEDTSPRGLLKQRRGDHGGYTDSMDLHSSHGKHQRLLS